MLRPPATPTVFIREASRGTVTRATDRQTARQWQGYYRRTAKRPPRELLLRVLDHIDREGRGKANRTAIDLGFGAGNDTLELLRRGWRVLAIDGQEGAARFLARRVPPRLRGSLTTLVAPMEGLELPPADLIYASFSLPFCAPERFSALWSTLRRSLRPGGHFAGQLFGEQDAWARNPAMTFHSRAQVLRRARGLRIEMIRETVEEGWTTTGRKHWHFFDVILEKPGTARGKRRSRRRAGDRSPARRLARNPRAVRGPRGRR